MGRVRSEMAYRPGCGRLVVSAPERMSEPTVSRQATRTQEGSVGACSVLSPVLILTALHYHAA